MKQLPLHEDHAKRGAVFLEQSGWEVPAHYGDPSAGYSAVRNAVGIMDLSSRGKIRVTGEDRVKWLQSIISYDILPLTPGQGIYSTFLTHKGKIIAYFRVYQLGDALMLEDVGETGETDIEILVPSGELRSAWERLWTTGDSMGLQPFGTQALETLRVEAGLPKMGPDLNENIVPPEANLEGKSFSLSKGCYPGQEVVARMDTCGSVRRRLVGLTLSESAVPLSGAKIYSGDREVGWVSSA